MTLHNPHLSEPDQTIEAAGRWTRLLARLLDGLIWFAPVPLLFFPCIGPVAALGLWAAILITQVSLLMRQGQTLGKKMLGLYIMRSDGGIPNLGWILAREFAIPAAVAILRVAGHRDPSPIGQCIQGLLTLMGLIDCLFIFGPTRRCLHDLVAGTHVVKVG